MVEVPADRGMETSAPSLSALFFGFTVVGLSGFGGVLPFARNMLVEDKRWLDAREFNELLGLCQFLPGPNVVNLCVVVGRRFHGLAGAIIAVTGLLGAPFIIALMLAAAYGLWGHLPWVGHVLTGVAASGAGLLLATALKMARHVLHGKVFLPLGVFVVIGVAGLHWPLHWVMLGMLPISVGLAILLEHRK